ncbi:hypothetical protein R84B8_01293 [Treponema sp. R8-4-B8]
MNKINDYKDKIQKIDTYSGQKKYNAVNDLFSDMATDAIGAIFSGIKGIFDRRQQKKWEAEAARLKAERLERERKAEAERQELLRLEIERKKRIARRKKIFAFKILVVLAIICGIIYFIFFKNIFGGKP